MGCVRPRFNSWQPDKCMKYNIKDRVYGEIEISEPVLVEIINSPSLQRLKKISQAGYFEPYFPGTWHSRFEHSLGVCILLKKYGASIEEQIAGLIHDVSHSAFSHCIDYVLSAGSEKEHCHQDNVFYDYIKKTEIPEILRKYNFDVEYILDESNFPLEEKNLPQLCADRIDYSLRAALVFNEINDAQSFLENLYVEDSNWVFKNFESAKKYAELFLKLNENYFAGIHSAIMFCTVGEYLKYALNKGYISEKDLYTNDDFVLSKIDSFLSKDEHLSFLFKKMNNKIKCDNQLDDFDNEIFCKSRIVDPLCYHNRKLKLVSQIDSNWKEIVKDYSKPKQYFLKFKQ